jgi:hypothetical protein
MPFAPFDVLVPVKANVLGLRRRLDALAIGTARRRLGQPAVLGSAVPTGTASP